METIIQANVKGNEQTTLLHNDQLHLPECLINLHEPMSPGIGGASFEESIESQKTLEVFHFDKAYKEGGNIEFYTPDNLSKRQAIREEPEVVNFLDKFYKTYRSRKNKERPGYVHKMEVTFVNVLICKALFDPEEWSVDDAWKAVEEDWEREVKGEDWMSEQQLKDSIFEIADLWTDDVQKTSYVLMLEELYKCITTISEENRSHWTELRSVSAMSSRRNNESSPRQNTLSNLARKLTQSGRSMMRSMDGSFRSSKGTSAFGNVVDEAMVVEQQKRNPWSIFRTVMLMAGLMAKKSQAMQGRDLEEPSSNAIPEGEEHNTSISEWGAVQNYVENTADFMDHLHQRLNLDQTGSVENLNAEEAESNQQEKQTDSQRKEEQMAMSAEDWQPESRDSEDGFSPPSVDDEDDKARRKKKRQPKDVSRLKITTGKLRNGAPIRLKQGQRLELSKNFKFHGTPRKIGVSSTRVWDHLVEGDEILLGYPYAKATLKVSEITDKSLIVIVGHSTVVADNETLYVDGLSSTAKPHMPPTSVDYVATPPSNNTNAQTRPHGNTSVHPPRRRSQHNRPLQSLSMGADDTRDFVSLDGQELPSLSLSQVNSNNNSGLQTPVMSPRSGSPQRTYLASLKNEELNTKARQMVGHPAIIDVGGSIGGVVGHNMNAGDALKESSPRQSMKVRVMNRPVPFKPNQKQRFGMYSGRASRRTSVKESNTALKQKQFTDVVISNGSPMSVPLRGSIAKGSAFARNRSRQGPPPIDNSFPVLTGLAAAASNKGNKIKNVLNIKSAKSSTVT